MVAGEMWKGGNRVSMVTRNGDGAVREQAEGSKVEGG